MKKNKVLPYLLAAVIIILLCLSLSKMIFNHVSPVAETDTLSFAEEFSSTAVSSSIESSSVNNEEAPFTQGVKIKKFRGNYACFEFKTPDNIVVICDPFYMDETVAADIVTESHQHMDHNDESKLTGDYKLIKTAKEFNEKGIKIQGFSGVHGRYDKPGTNIMYLFDINGLRIAHFASQGTVPDDKTLDAMDSVDVLLIQVFPEKGDTYSKLDLDDFKAICDKLKSKIIIPEHGSTSIGETLADALGAKAEIRNGKDLIITRAMLDEQRDIRVIDLDHD